MQDERRVESDGRTAVLTEASLGELIALLRRQGHLVVGPTLVDGAILYDEIGGLEDLPAGWTDRQTSGSYRVERRDDQALFGYVVGPQSWKRFFHPERLRLWRAKREGESVSLVEESQAPPKLALLAARSCELHAIAIQDKVFLSSDFRDEDYALRRAETFVVAVDCGEAGGTCFCLSMETGPKAGTGFDLALTELLDEAGHRFLARAGSAAGRALLDELESREPSRDDLAAATAATERASRQMGRSLETEGLKELLQENPEHPRWDQVAARCLSCANCTLVCPTCFCSTVEETSDLDGSHAERWRRWDSCFTLDFSYIHGGSVRSSAKSRYRQWMTHKLAHWIDQFGTSGCVGCGRCITWCPVAIDITEEAAAIRADVAGGQP
ncbi:MAG: 4Fe-4S dicluster domain-containing protein [Rhodospirillales bacterium]